MNNTEQKANEPAFHTHNGLTTRDYFAAAAMTGLLAGTGFSNASEVVAKESYIRADAMIAHSLNVPDTMAAQADEIASLKRRLFEMGGGGDVPTHIEGEA